MSQIFEIVIYTASAREYAEIILEELDLSSYISRIFHRNHCIQAKGNTRLRFKNLESVGPDLKRIIFIDVSLLIALTKFHAFKLIGLYYPNPFVSEEQYSNYVV